MFLKNGKKRIQNEVIMDIDNFVKKVLIMRTAQKDYFKCRFPDLLRKAKLLESEIDREIKKYYEEKVNKDQGTFFVNDH